MGINSILITLINPPEVQVTSGQQLCTKIVLHRIANICVTVSNIFLKEIISNNTTC